MFRDGVTLHGDLVLTNPQTTLSLLDGSDFTGDAYLLAADTTLSVNPVTEISNRTIHLEGENATLISPLMPPRLQLLETTLVRGRGAVSLFDNYGIIRSDLNDTLTLSFFSNFGLIEALSGSTIRTQNSFINQGIIQIESGATLQLDGGVNLFTWGTINYEPGSRVDLTGSMQLAGSTLAVETSGEEWALRGGQIRDGVLTIASNNQTLDTSGGNLFDLTLVGNVRLDQVGNLSVSQSTITGDLEFASAGTVNSARAQRSTAMRRWWQMRHCSFRRTTVW